MAKLPSRNYTTRPDIPENPARFEEERRRALYHHDIPPRVQRDVRRYVPRKYVHGRKG